MSMSYRIAVIVFLLMAPRLATAQAPVWSADIQQVNVNMRGAAVELGQVTIEAPEDGIVLVQFDGNAVVAEGDRILLAASDAVSWGVNDGHTQVEAVDSDVNRHSFSHSRSYRVSAGSHTFYAVGQNFVETDGSGIASVYANLTVKFFGDTGSPRLFHQGIVKVNENLRTAAVELASQTIDVAVAGRVLVHFTGMCVSDVGDLIVLAASDEVNWGVNDGNTLCEAVDSDLNNSPFSHTRMYEVGPGTHTFYAVGQNFVKQAGDGEASIYGSLTVEFYPDDLTGPVVLHTGVNETNIDIETSVVTVGELTLDALREGKVVVRFDGIGLGDVGDRVVLAASNTENWTANAGNVNFEGIANNYHTGGFSHRRVYDIRAGGMHTYYAVAQNFVETAGSGIASIYGSLTVQYYPRPSGVAVEESDLPETNVELLPNYPNPFAASTTISYAVEGRAPIAVTVYDALGRRVRSLVAEVQNAGSYTTTWDGRNDAGAALPSGPYFYRLDSGAKSVTRQMVLVR